MQTGDTESSLLELYWGEAYIIKIDNFAKYKKEQSVANQM